MNRLLATALGTTHANGLSWALLAIRLVMGAAFVCHGAGKMAAPFSWMPGGFMPGWLLALAAFSEYAGGMALIAGLLTRPAAFGLFCTMAVAVVMAHLLQGDPFVSPTGGPSYELALVYAACAFLLLITGSGRFGVDAWLHRR